VLLDGDLESGGGIFESAHQAEGFAEIVLSFADHSELDGAGDHLDSGIEFPDLKRDDAEQMPRVGTVLILRENLAIDLLRLLKLPSLVVGDGGSKCFFHVELLHLVTEANGAAGADQCFGHS
jgi:hypothetical protein